MDAAALSTLIANLGFPIACVIAMFWLNNKEREDHKAEMQEVTKAITNNTLALQSLIDMINSREFERHE